MTSTASATKTAENIQPITQSQNSYLWPWGRTHTYIPRNQRAPATGRRVPGLISTG